jgi:hypothetical protein
VESVFYEAQAVFHALTEALHVTHKRTARRFVNRHALVFPGFIAPSFIYAELLSTLNVLGIFATVVSHRLSLAAQVRRPHDELMGNVMRYQRWYGTPDYLIGHSFGSLEALSFLPYLQDARVIAFAPPLKLSIPRSILALGEALGIIPELLEEQNFRRVVEEVGPYQEQITLVYSTSDRLCPPDRKTLPKARTLIIEDVTSAGKKMRTREKPIYQTHIGLPFSRTIAQGLDS